MSDHCLQIQHFTLLLQGLLKLFNQANIQSPLHMLEYVHVIHCYNVASENATSVNVRSVYQSCFCASAAEHGVVSIPLFAYQPFVISQIQKTNLQPETGTIMDHVLSVNKPSCNCFCQQFLVIGNTQKPSPSLTGLFMVTGSGPQAPQPLAPAMARHLTRHPGIQWTSDPKRKNIATIKRCAHLQIFSISLIGMDIEYWIRHHFPGSTWRIMLYHI